MISITTAIVVGVICVCVEAFFSGSEIALVSANRAYLRQRAKHGDRGAQLAENLMREPQVLLATTLVGTNLATVTFSVTVALALLAHEAASSELLAVLLVSPNTMLFGEIIPKTFFQQHADQLAPRIIYPLHAASIILRPAIWLMSGFVSLMTRVLGTERQRAFITRDELALLIESESSEKSEITEEEREMIANVFELSEAEIHQVMVPLSEVTALPADTPLEQAINHVVDTQYSRIPIFQERVHNVTGVVHVFDLLSAITSGKECVLQEIARPACFVPESKPAVDLLVELQGTGDHMAVVVDEYGGAVGVVTVEDLLEEVVGAIEDEYDPGPSPIRQLRPGVWRVEARTPVERINEELDLELPESDDYESIAGILLEHFKRIPEPGESLLIGPVTIHVVEASDRAVEVVQILRRRLK